MTTPVQKAAIELSQVREKLAEKITIPEPSESDLKAIDELTGKIPALEKRHRAAQLAEPDPPPPRSRTRIRRRRGQPGGPGCEVRLRAADGMPRLRARPGWGRTGVAPGTQIRPDGLPPARCGPRRQRRVPAGVPSAQAGRPGRTGPRPGTGPRSPESGGGACEVVCRGTW